MSAPDKRAVITALRRQLHSELDALETATGMSQSEATHDEAQPEDEADTRALEASYLAEGQSERLRDLHQLVGWFDALDPGYHHNKVALGALVCVEHEDGRRRWLVVAPTGGDKVTVDGVDVQVVSLHSPLGKALAGLSGEDGVESEDDTWDLTVVSVR